METNFDAFLNSLPIMGKGMLGIFIVTIVILAAIYLLNTITGALSDIKQAKKEQNK